MNAEDVPAATEMPEAVRKVCHRLRHLAMTSAIACRIGDRDEFDEYADALESWWRTHAAQPVKAPRPKLEKVRNGLESARHRLCCLTSEVFTSSFTDRYKDGPACEKTLVAVQAALAELDAAEGRK